MLEYTLGNIRTWSRLGSCGSFGIAALELPQIDNGIVMLTADLCFYSGLDRFKAAYPDRLYNCGIAEQNMVGIAAGFAKEGFTPFATTYATFASMRCADQVKVNMGYMKLDVKLVGLTAGLSVGILGATHISTEDIAVMRAIPNITILSPADCTETIKAVFAAAQLKGPVYLRLSGTMPNPIVYHHDYDYQVGKAITLKDGNDVAIIATGTMVYNSLKTAEYMDEKGISTKVIDMHTIKPIDTDSIEDACKAKLIVTVEEHSRIGGLGAAVAETLSEKQFRPPHYIIGTKDMYEHAGDYGYLIEQYGLSVNQLYKTITEKYREVASKK